MNKIFFLSVLCLISGILIIYYLSTKYGDFFTIICLFCISIVCILLVSLIYIIVNSILIQAGENAGELPINIDEFLKKPLIRHVLCYCCFALEIKYISCGVLVSLISPFLFVYCMLSENVFSQNKLGPITFLFTEACAFTIFSFLGEYLLIGHFTTFIIYSIIFALVVFLSFALFLRNLWECEEQTQKNKMEDLLKNRKFRQKRK